MKYKTLYFSLLKTYLKSDVKLNIFIFLISAFFCSVLFIEKAKKSDTANAVSLFLVNGNQ